MYWIRFFAETPTIVWVPALVVLLLLVVLLGRFEVMILFWVMFTAKIGVQVQRIKGRPEGKHVFRVLLL